MPRNELAARFAHALRNIDLTSATPEDVGTILARTFYRIEDEWEEIDVHDLGQAPGSDVLLQRHLVARMPVQAMNRRPDRTVSS